MGSVDGRDFRRILRGYDPGEVDPVIEQLTDELAAVRAQLEETEAAYTQLRLNAAKQVEDAGAEANALLANARSEAARIRQEANEQSQQTRDEATAAAHNLHSESERAVATAARESQEQVEKAKKEVARAESRAQEIVQFANSRAEKLKSEASDVLRAAEERAQASDNQIRLATLELERKESDVRDQADGYARKTYLEADRYAQSTERRARELQAHAEQIVREAKRRGEEITAQALDYAKNVLGDAVEQMTQVSHDVSGSMAIVNRMRRLVSDQLERVSSMEPPQTSLSEGAGLSSVEGFLQVSRGEQAQHDREANAEETGSLDDWLGQSANEDVDSDDDGFDRASGRNNSKPDFDGDTPETNTGS